MQLFLIQQLVLHATLDTRYQIMIAVSLILINHIITLVQPNQVTQANVTHTLMVWQITKTKQDVYMMAIQFAILVLLENSLKTELALALAQTLVAMNVQMPLLAQNANQDID